LIMTLEYIRDQLLKKPFDNRLRRQYAGELMEHRLWEAALEQLEIVRDQGRMDAETMTQMALCHLRLDNAQKAAETYSEAKPFDDFRPHEELDALESNAIPDAGHLSVVKKKTAEIVPINRGAADRVTFNDIGGMEDVKNTLRLQIIEPFLKPGLFDKFKKKAGGGVLLYGPPGCGKTMIAKAIATECNLTFMSVGISDVLNMWLGESERNLAAMFEKARSEKPCLMFFDELDALAFSRSKAHSEHTRTVVNEFLSQLDGFGQDNDQILILAATNMPWDVDPAMKRPGRFAKQIFVPPPDKAARAKILEIKLRDIPCDPLDYPSLADRLEFFSGADIDGLIDLAKESALMDIMKGGGERNLRLQDINTAIDDIIPSTTEWLRTARNLVTYAGADKTYKDVETYLKKTKFQ
jgi:SpoVK/Ycf46/Vps4 family AAA+-type ATPase